MKPEPVTNTDYPGAGKLTDKVALLTGGDSGSGRAVAVLFAKEGADIAIAYLSEHTDADETKRLVETEGPPGQTAQLRSEEHKSELQSLMRRSYADICLKKKKQDNPTQAHNNQPILVQRICTRDHINTNT